MRRRLCILLATAIIAAYLTVSRGRWFDDLERDLEIGASALYSNPLDVSTAQDINWLIPNVPWVYERSEARLSLVVDRASCGSTVQFDRSSPSLRIKVHALGKPESGGEFDRLIHNWYFRTDDPLAPDSRMWRTSSTTDIEYGLAGLSTYPFETLEVSISVVTPDPALASCRPRLKLVGENDYAVAHHLPPLRLLRDIGIGFCAVALIYLSRLAWKKPESKTLA
jgi:hypothetical protein